MNPQINEAFGSIGVLVLMLTFIYFFVKKYESVEPDRQTDWDSVVIGHVVTPSRIKPVLSKVDDAFYKECVETLRSIGFKANESKALAKKVFDNESPTDITDFITLSMRYK